MKILENIKNFDVDDKFKQMILKYMINNINREEVMSSYKNAYYAMDINHNGWIEVSEFKKIIKLSIINISEILFN